MEENVVEEGDNVIFKRNNSCRAFQIRKNRQVFFEKNKFSVSELIGQPYGSTFEIDKGKLIKVDRQKDNSEFGAAVLDPSTDNRDLKDLDSNQRMSKDDIMKLKEEGVTGEKIIEELIENSETFKSKTEFSQAKYLKKKKKKHIIVFTVLRPTPRLVLQIYAKEPQKICNLRADTLSQLLSFSDVMCGSNVALVETCHGLVLSCVLQRLAGQGKLIQLIPNNSSQVYRQVTNYFGFSKADFQNVYTLPMSVLGDLQRNRDRRQGNSLNSDINGESNENCDKMPQDVPEEKSKMDTSIKEEISLIENMKVENETHTGDDDDLGDKGVRGEELKDEEEEEGSTKLGPNRQMQRHTRAVRHKEAADLILSKNLDCLIVACKYNPAPIVKKLVEFLPSSRPVVVYCQFLEPLVEIYLFIKEQHIGLQVKLSDTWLREYQILPQRTHPMMNMSGTGGFLLTFITCDPGA